MRLAILLFVLGLALGAAAALAVRSGDGSEAAPRAARTESPALSAARRTIAELRAAAEGYRSQVAEQTKANEALRATVDELERSRKAPPPAEPAEEEAPPKAPTGRPTSEEMEAGLRDFGSKLQSLIVGGKEGKEAAARLRALLARAGPEAMQELVKMFEDGATDIQRRIVLAHVLGQSEDPVAIEVLKSTLQDPDAGLMMHRFASHGLAFSDAEGLDQFMTEIAENATDTGVRANTAFGLNRRGIEKGMDLYFAATDEAFQKGDPAALQYLGGLSIMGERALPGMRERLRTYKEEQALLVLIAILQGAGDKGAIPALQELTQDASRPTSVRKAAEGALKKLGQSKEQ